MKRIRVLAASAVICVAACGDDLLGPTPPASPEIEPAATAAEIEAYLPAISDASSRILPAGNSPALLGPIEDHLSDLRTALRERRAIGASQAVADAREQLALCDSDCLSVPDQGVIELVLDHADRLIGLE